MKVSLFCVCLLFFVTSVGCTTKPEETSAKPKDPHPDLIAMQGLWKKDYYEINGELIKVAGREREDYYVFLQDTYFSYWALDGFLYDPNPPNPKLNTVHKFKLDPEKNPKRFTTSFTDITGDKVNTHIYKFENNHLVIGYDPIHKKYPKDFTTQKQKHDGRITVYLRRVGNYKEEEAWYKIKRPWEKEAQKVNLKRQSKPKKKNDSPLVDAIAKDTIKQLDSSSSKKRKAACDELWNMTYNAQGALPTLKKMKEKDKSAKVRKAAKRAYDHIYDKTYPIIEPEKKKKK